MAFPKLNSLDLPGDPKDTRIVVAMSGGVDSSVVAGLLAREGYDVVGMTLQLYDHGEAIHRKGACCAGQDIHDARRVAEALGIPHYVLDYEDKFREQVINPFMDSYIAGETPIPCVACNQTVKFADLLATAKELGAAALATGHYIRSHLADQETGTKLADYLAEHDVTIIGGRNLRLVTHLGITTDDIDKHHKRYYRCSFAHLSLY